MSNTPEVYDPCAAYRRLRDALEKLALGQSVKGVRYKNGEEERQTDFNPANAGEVRRLMLEAQAECQALTSGGRPRRSAIGFSRHRRPFSGGM